MDEEQQRAMELEKVLRELTDSEDDEEQKAGGGDGLDRLPGSVRQDSGHVANDYSAGIFAQDGRPPTVFLNNEDLAELTVDEEGIEEEEEEEEEEAEEMDALAEGLASGHRTAPPKGVTEMHAARDPRKTNVLWRRFGHDPYANPDTPTPASRYSPGTDTGSSYSSPRIDLGDMDDEYDVEDEKPLDDGGLTGEDNASGGADAHNQGGRATSASKPSKRSFRREIKGNGGAKILRHRHGAFGMSASIEPRSRAAPNTHDVQLEGDGSFHHRVNGRRRSGSLSPYVVSETQPPTRERDHWAADLEAELRSLRTLNDKLVRNNEENQKAIDALVYEKEVAILEVKEECDKKLLEFQRSERERRMELQTQIASLQEELSLARQATTHITSIRATLQREKDLDLLETRRELLQQKERALEEMRQEMQEEKDEAARRAAEEVKRKAATFDREKEEMQVTVKELQVRLREAELAADADRRDLAKMIAQLEEERGKQRESLMKIVQDFNASATETGSARDGNSDGYFDAPVIPVTSDASHAELVSMITTHYFVTRELFTKRLAACREKLQEATRTCQTLESRLPEQLDQLRRELEAKHAEVKRKLEWQTNHDIQAAVQARAQLEQNARESSQRAARLRTENHELQLKLRQCQQHAREEQEQRERLSSRLCDLQAQAELPKLPEELTAEALEQRYPELITAIRNTALENELDAAALKLRSQCSRAYDAAVTKLKAGYAKLEAKMKEKFRKQMDEEQRKFEERLERERALLEDEANARLEEELEKERRVLEEAGSERIMKLERLVATLKSDVSELRWQHASEMQALMERCESEKEAGLARSKERYLATLRMMRDDIAASKARGAERMEEEWSRRKAKLDKAWGERLMQLTAHYDTELIQLGTSPAMRIQAGPSKQYQPQRGDYSGASEKVTSHRTADADIPASRLPSRCKPDIEQPRQATASPGACAAQKPPLPSSHFARPTYASLSHARDRAKKVSLASSLSAKYDACGTATGNTLAEKSAGSNRKGGVLREF